MTTRRTTGLILSLILAGCQPQPLPEPASSLPTSASQVIVVHPAGEPPRVEVTAWQRFGATWKRVLGPMPGVVGARGIAPPGEKREGDGRTPAGVFPLGLAFGYAAGADTSLAYRQATADDYWIDDPASPEYNRWVHGPKPTASHERMRRDDNQYELGVVIGYNTDPVVPGLGSAIFLHVWEGPGRGTSGCVGLAAEDVRQVVRWLRAEAVIDILAVQ